MNGVPIYSSSHAANIGKRNYQLHLSTFASHASQLLFLSLHGSQKNSPMNSENIFTMQNYFRGLDYYRHVLQPVSGDISTKGKVLFEAIAHDVLCSVSKDAIKTEVCIEPLGIYYFVLKILANPY